MTYQKVPYKIACRVSHPFLAELQTAADIRMVSINDIVRLAIVDFFQCPINAGVIKEIKELKIRTRGNMCHRLAILISDAYLDKMSELSNEMKVSFSEIIRYALVLFIKRDERETRPPIIKTYQSPNKGRGVYV